MNTFLDFFKNNKYLIIIIILVIIFSHGYSLTISNDLSIDDENFFRTSTSERASMWVSSGRYGISAINLIMFPVFDNLPFFNLLFALIFLGFASYILCYFFSKILKSVKIPKLAYTFLSIMIISYPLHVDALSFTCINMQVMLSLNISLIGVYYITRWVFEKKGLGLAILGVLMSWFSISVFQSFAGVHITLAVAFSLAYLLEATFQKSRFSFGYVVTIIVKQALLFLISLALYYIGSFAIRTITEIKSNGYADSLMNMNSPRQILNNIWYNIKINYFGDNVHDSGIAKYIVAVFLISQISLLFKKEIINKVWIILISVILIFAPFSLTVIRGGIALRALTGFPIMLGLCGFFMIITANLWIEKLQTNRVKKFATIVMVFLTIVIGYVNMYNNNLYYYATHIRYIRDETLARSIAEDIIDMTRDDAPDKPIIVVGQYDIKEMENGLSYGFNESLFNFDIVYIRSVYLMNYIGYKFNPPTHEQFLKHKAKAEDMPVWPQKGSIVEYNDVIVVKLSESE